MWIRFPVHSPGVKHAILPIERRERDGSKIRRRYSISSVNAACLARSLARFQTAALQKLDDT